MKIWQAIVLWYGKKGVVYSALLSSTVCADTNKLIQRHFADIKELFKFGIEYKNVIQMYFNHPQSCANNMFHFGIIIPYTHANELHCGNICGHLK